MAIAAGQRIVCESGHVCGMTLANLADGAVIAPADFKITNAATVQTGYLCGECRKPVAVMQAGKWRISTSDGWLG